MGVAQITDRNTRAKDFTEDGAVDITVYNNSGLNFGIGDFVAIDMADLSISSSDTVAKEKAVYYTSATSTNVKVESGFTLETINSGDRGKVRIKGIHTSAYVATGSSTLANGLPVGFDGTPGASGYNKTAYSSNQGVGSSATIVAGYVISATSKLIYVV